MWALFGGVIGINSIDFVVVLADRSNSIKPEGSIDEYCWSVCLKVCVLNVNYHEFVHLSIC